jgi:hypothetical protein
VSHEIRAIAKKPDIANGIERATSCVRFAVSAITSNKEPKEPAATKLVQGGRRTLDTSMGIAKKKMLLPPTSSLGSSPKTMTPISKTTKRNLARVPYPERSSKMTITSPANIVIVTGKSQSVSSKRTFPIRTRISVTSSCKMARITVHPTRMASRFSRRISSDSIDGSSNKLQSTAIGRYSPLNFLLTLLHIID